MLFYSFSKLYNQLLQIKTYFVKIDYKDNADSNVALPNHTKFSICAYASC